MLLEIFFNSPWISIFFSVNRRHGTARSVTLYLHIILRAAPFPPARTGVEAGSAVRLLQSFLSVYYLLKSPARNARINQ